MSPNAPVPDFQPANGTTSADVCTNHANGRPNKPTVVGLYGLPGSGKSFLLRQLQDSLSEPDLAFFEGSAVINSIYPGGLGAFQRSTTAAKENTRHEAMSHIALACAEHNLTGVVAGHLMFWRGDNLDPELVWTDTDAEVYTHILYHEVRPEDIAQRRADDQHRGIRDRPGLSVEQLRSWQALEIDTLRALCLKNRIMFTVISSPAHSSLPVTSRALDLLRDIRNHKEQENMDQAMRESDEAVSMSGAPRFGSMLVLDADKTLTAVDTGMLFWEVLETSRGSTNKEKTCPLRKLFGSPLGYSYGAFRQASLLYEEATDYEEFDAICHHVACGVVIRPELASLVRRATMEAHAGVVIVTCGLRLIWEKVLQKEGLADKVRVIGAGRMSDTQALVVTAEVKAAIVRRLREKHLLHVTAMGDSVLDVPMLKAADEAVIVVGKEATRSRSLKAALETAEHASFKGRQWLFPTDSPPFLDIQRFPIINAGDLVFIDSIFRRHSPSGKFDLQIATDNAAKLLMTPTRDARIAGPALREAHARVGWYLAMTFITRALGTQEYDIPHVQGHLTAGHQLLNEELTLIVPLMRGGEAMAFGVNDAFPKAGMVHAKHPEDLRAEHLQGRQNVILVDSVINSGKSVALFVRHVRAVAPDAGIVIVAGVVQKGALTEGQYAMQTLASESERGVTLVALRVSDNKFTGRGGTDTGHRLFNTTYLP